MLQDSVPRSYSLTRQVPGSHTLGLWLLNVFLVQAVFSKTYKCHGIKNRVTEDLNVYKEKPELVSVFKSSLAINTVLPKEMSQCSHEQRTQCPASPKCLPASCSDGLYASCVLCAFQNVLHSME